MAQWEYCLLTCTPMTGLEKDRVRLAYQLVTPECTVQDEIHSDAALPLAAIVPLLNRLGADGWELVTYDTTTNRGVFRRPKA